MQTILNYKNLFFWISVLSISCGYAQSAFHIDGGKKSFKLSYQEVNNLMIIPVELNGVELSFLLDTGVDSTILFKIPENDSLDIKNPSKIWIKGIGMANPVEGFKSEGNVLKVGKAINDNFTYYAVYEEHIDLSLRMGLPVHGIIGYDFFKDFIVELRYVQNKIKVSDPALYKHRKCRRCEDFELKFHKNKPYISLAAQLNDESVNLNLLVDSGSGNALWLFANGSKQLKIPERNFPDFLGYGFGGSIYGVKGRTEELNFGKYQLTEITTSFPDSTFTHVMNDFIHRDGSLGAQILNRFKVVIDYKGEKILLKPNRKFKDPFKYDMSGVVVAQTGYSFVKRTFYRADGRGNMNALENNDSVRLFLRPEYEVVEVRPNSPADISGLRIGDIIKKINGKPAHNFSLEEIISYFSTPEGKEINLKVERDGVENVTCFELKQVL